MILWALGFPDKALHRAVGTVDLAKRLNHPFSIAYALFHTGLLHLWTRQIEPAEAYAHELEALAEAYKFTIWKAVGSCLHGSALAALGREEQGLNQFFWGMDVYQGLNTPPIFWSLLVFNLAQAYLDVGKPQEGLDHLAVLMNSTEESKEGALLAEFCRLRGALLLGVSQQNAAEAQVWFEQAIEISRQQEARLLELRAAVCLSRLWQEQGKGEQARQLLGEVYHAMTEGFDTPDMIAARELLESARTDTL